ncbi:MAG: tetratricopeptide repeat protein [Elusimicrobiota bacterium]
MKKIIFLFVILFAGSYFFAEQQKKSDEEIALIKIKIEQIKAAVNPKNPAPDYIKIAHLYLSIEDIDNALLYFEKAKNFDPLNASIYYMIAMIYEKKKDYTKAIENWENCLKYSKSKQLTDIASKHIKYLKEMK